MTAYAVTADRAEPVATIAASSMDAVIAAIESGAQRVESHRLLARISTGDGMDGASRARCSCGWKSEPHYAHDDWQSTNLRMDEAAHLKGRKV